MQTSSTLKLAQELMACPSITPDDAGCQEIIAKRLEAFDFEIHHLPFGNVKNLWALRGNARPSLIFAGHTDVVPPGNLEHWQTPPFSPTIRDGFLFGRGAADMKGGLSAMITATERFIQKHPAHEGAIAFLITSDEEGLATHGTVKVIEKLQTEQFAFDYCIVGEPTSQETLGDILKPGCRGSLNGFLKIKGLQGHIAYPNEKNPIHLILKPLSELIDIHWDEGGPLFPKTSFQCSNIQSGTGTTNVIPGELKLTFNWRFSPASTPESLLERLESILKNHALDYTLDWQLSGRPFITEGSYLIQCCEQAILEVVNQQADLYTGGGISDARFIAPTGAEVIEFGLVNRSIHAVNECVSVADLEHLSQIYERILELILLKKS